MTDEEVLELHGQLVAIPSVSGEERRLADWLTDYLKAAGAPVQRVGDSLLVCWGEGPVLCLNSHLDTVPPVEGWSRPPFEPTRENGRVFGLGSNDAKASVAAMIAAGLELGGQAAELGVTVALMLVAGEETGGGGTEETLQVLEGEWGRPVAVVVGEPTSLDVAHAQKGLVVVELRARGEASHAAHGANKRNAIFMLAHDLVVLEGLELGPPDPALGPITALPTVVAGGRARNAVPAEATCVVDVRVNPEPSPEEVVSRLAAALSSEVVVLSARLRPYATPPGHPLVRAALAARPQARLVASRTVSDLVHFVGVPGIKAGPGESRRSHTADEYVEEWEILAAVNFYKELGRRWAELLRQGVGA